MQPLQNVDRWYARFRENGDLRALARVFDATAPELVRVAMHLTGDLHQTEDLVQDTFLTALTKSSRYDPRQPLLPWLLTILANRVRQQRRRDARTLPRERMGGEVLPEDPLREAQDRELVGSLEKAVARLEPPYREVMTLHLCYGLSAKEIGHSLDRPAGTVRTQIVRGMERVRRAMPAGFSAAGVIAVPDVNLASVRAQVLQEAGAASGATALSVLGGVLVMNKILVGSTAAVVLAGAVWWVGFGQDGDAPENTPIATAHDEDRGATPEDPAPETPSPAEVGAERRIDREPLTTTDAAASPSLGVKVVYETGHSPAANVRVRLYPDDLDPELRERRGVTDSLGCWQVFDLDAGTWNVTTDRGPGRTEVEVANSGTQTVKLTIPPGVHVQGRVVDDRKRAVPGARIWLSVRTDLVNDGLMVATSDAQGQFRLEHVTPGRWLSARAEGHRAALCVEVTGEPGDEMPLTLTVVRGGGALIGEVVDEYGAPVPHAAVQVGFSYSWIPGSVGEMPPSARTWTDEDGFFDLQGLFPSRQDLWVRAPGFAVSRTQVDIKEQGETETLVTLEEGASVSGLVTDWDGNPVAGARIAALQDEVEPGLGMGYVGPSWARRSGMSGDDGRYHLGEIQSGPVKVRVRHSEGNAHHDVTLASGQAHEWNPVLSEGLAIEGVLVTEDGRPLPDWEVWGLSQQKGVSGTPPTLSDADGRFVFSRCEDATYRLEFRSPGSQMNSSQIRDVEVQAGDPPLRIVVPEDRIATSYLTGIVRDATGQVPENLWVSTALVQEDGTLAYAGLRDRGGDRFRIGPVLPGRYLVHASMSDGALGVDLGEFTVAAGEELDIGLHELPEPGYVVLTVSGSDGLPLKEGSFVVSPRGSYHGDVIRVQVGTGRSKGKAPGSYLVQPFGGPLPYFRHEVEVVSGQDHEVLITIPRGVARKISYPPTPADNSILTIVLRDASGTVVYEKTSMWDRRDEPYETVRFFVPGAYTIEITDLAGNQATKEFVIGERDDVETVLVWPSPWE